MEIIPKWKNHPLTKQGVVELVPTKWLYTLYGPDVTPQADLMDGTLVDLETLWENVLQDGLHEPLIIRVGKTNKKFRLESGNHRIQVFFQHGVEYTPATVQIQNECGPHVDNVMTNASHNFSFQEKIDLATVAIGYAKPSTIFPELQQQTHHFSGALTQ